MLNPKRNIVTFQDDKLLVVKKGSYYEIQSKTGFILNYFDSKLVSTKADIYIEINLPKWRRKC